MTFARSARRSAPRAAAPFTLALALAASSCGASSPLFEDPRGPDGGGARPASSDLRIASLTSANCRVFDHNTVTGDDRGGIAAGSESVFYTGDTSTGRFAASDLSGATALGRVHDGLVSNVRTGTVYVFASGGQPITGMLPGVITELIELDAAGALTSNRVTLSRAIDAAGGGGGGARDAAIFAGSDRVAVLVSGRLHVIALPSGAVTDAGALALPVRQRCENWATWGVLENTGSDLAVVYVRNGREIARTRVADGATSVIATFSNLSDMCSFTVLPSRGRWYFHHEYMSQFTPTISETVGFCDATFDR